MLSFTKVIESSTTCTWFFEKIITFYYTSPIYFLFAAHVSSFLFLHMKSILRSSSSFLSCVTDNIFLLFYSFLVTSNFFSLFPSFYGSSHSRKSLLTVWTWKFPDLRDFSERARQLIFNLLYGFYDARSISRARKDIHFHFVAPVFGFHDTRITRKIIHVSLFGAL